MFIGMEFCEPQASLLQYSWRHPPTLREAFTLQIPPPPRAVEWVNQKWNGSIRSGLPREQKRKLDTTETDKTQLILVGND
jgi:hypothetical protein